ncbi:MFS transporter [Deinococcus sp. QL22]|uniref:MFS transporter n=1 Tax=Deinococcus sp. QL22 TaxID=2939437 RepID=UPI00201786AA|nr:MFS transporter [Deinococcus sp. QL22]UQN06100.1 MFS transporter [Deinococcus sp. QL22]
MMKAGAGKSGGGMMRGRAGIIVAITIAALLLAAGARSAPGVFLKPMEVGTGFSLTTLSAAVSVGLLMFGLGAPLSGYLMDRHGPRRVATFGLLLVALSFGLSALIRTEAHLFILWGVLSGLGTGLVGSVLGATVAARWFQSQRGLVTGVFGAATSAGQLMFIPLLTLAAQGAGWRWASAGIGLLALLLTPLFWALLRDRPAEVGLGMDGRPLDPAAPVVVPAKPDGSVMRRALRSRDFWLLSITFLVCGATSNGIIGTHFIAYCGDLGLTAGYAAGMLALMGAFNFVGTLGSGYLTDRVDPRLLLAAYYAFRGLSLLALPLLPPGTGLVFFAVLFGLDYIATVPPTVALTARTFGTANVGTVYGWVFFSHQVGAASATALGGLVRESLGTYGPAFLAAGVLAILAAGLALGVTRQPSVRAAAA